MSAVPDEVSSCEPSGETPAIAIKLEYPDRYNGKSRFREAHPLSSSSDDALDSPPESNKLKRPRVAEPWPLKAREDDAKRLASRQKQIDYGKSTTGYQNYLGQIAKKARKREHPRTPDKNQACSKRSWDGQVAKWRRSLHAFDPE